MFSRGFYISTVADADLYRTKTTNRDAKTNYYSYYSEVLAGSTFSLEIPASNRNLSEWANWSWKALIPSVSCLLLLSWRRRDDLR